MCTSLSLTSFVVHCTHVQVDAMEQLIGAYPDAYYIHTRRASIDSQVASMDADHILECVERGGLLHRWSSHKILILIC